MSVTDEVGEQVLGRASLLDEYRVWADEDAQFPEDEGFYDFRSLTVPAALRERLGDAAPPVELVPRLAGVPGPEYACVPPDSTLATLLEIFEPARLSDADLVDYAAACERLVAWVQSRQLAAVSVLTVRCARLGEVDGGRNELAPEQLAAAELGPALALSGFAAGRLVDTAAGLDRLPLTTAALGDGTLSLYKARAVLDAVANLPLAEARAVEAAVLGRDDTAGVTAATLKARLRRAVIAVDPAAAEQRHEDKARDRRVWREHLEDGMSRLGWEAPSHQIESTWQWLTALAQGVQDDERQAARDARAAGAPVPEVRTLDQIRSDILADLGATGLAGLDPLPQPTREAEATETKTPEPGPQQPASETSMRGVEPMAGCLRCAADAATTTRAAGTSLGRELPRRHGRRPQIHVVVTAETLLGLSEEPGELIGVGPIPASVARRIAAEGTWRRLLAEPGTRHLLEFATDTHDPPQDLRDFVITRDRTCRFPGCRRPANRADIDHNIAHPCGPTCAANLCCLCRTHHRVKTFGGVRLDNDGRGTMTWHMPSGKTWTSKAPPVLDVPPF